MKTIENRAREYALKAHPYEPFCSFWEGEYIKIATEQQKIDIEKACKEFRNFLEKRVDNPHYQLNRSDFDNWVNDFRSIMEE